MFAIVQENVFVSSKTKANHKFTRDEISDAEMVMPNLPKLSSVLRRASACENKKKKNKNN